jgi:predicted phage tail component-like protein
MAFNFTNGFTFDGRHSNEFFIVNAKERSILPPISSKLLTIHGRPGAYDFGTQAGVRQISVPVTLIDTNLRDKVNDIAAWLRPIGDNPQPLIFDDEPDKYYDARLVGGSALTELVTLGQTTLTFECADPAKYSLFTNAGITWGNEVITFQADYLLGATGGGSRTFAATGTYEVAYSGNDPTRPTITVEGSASSFSMSVGGQSFSLPAFTDATWTIDGADYSVKKNGTYSLVSITGDFLTIEHGINAMEIDGEGLDVSVSIVFRDKYK